MSNEQSGDKYHRDTPCTINGKIYCAPVNIHSWQWLWLSNAAFKKAGVAVPKNAALTIVSLSIA